MKTKVRQPAVNFKRFTVVILLTLFSIPYMLYEITIKPLADELFSSKQVLYKLTEEKKELLDLKNRARELEIERVALEQLISDLKNKNSTIHNYEGISTINRILDTLKAGKKKHSVKLSAISVQPSPHAGRNGESGANRTRARTITISFLSSYHDSILYIEEISKMSYPIHIQTVTMQTRKAMHRSATGKADRILTMMELKVYL